MVLLRGLEYYKIGLVHLNPNSLHHIAIFSLLCEDFFGIPPSFPLFQYYYILLLVPIRALTTAIRTSGDALYGSMDGPWPMVGRSVI